MKIDEHGNAIATSQSTMGSGLPPSYDGSGEGGPSF
jgi:hypothetical protein